jgi:hypothetical protein
LTVSALNAGRDGRHHASGVRGQPSHSGNEADYEDKSVDDATENLHE